MTPTETRGDRTREQLLDVAEQLFGAAGVANVSMRQIRVAAGQRNEGAVQYHFGDLMGVLAALVERHNPQVVEIQRRILDGYGARPSLRQLVDAMVRPFAEYCTLGASQRAWSVIIADLVSDPTLDFGTLQKDSPAQSVEVSMALFEKLCLKMPPEVAGERMWAVTQFVIHVAADRARLRDNPHPGRELSTDEAFITDLISMAYGALTAPVQATHSPSERSGEQHA